jgi:hypothetical protein
MKFLIKSTGIISVRQIITVKASSNNVLRIISRANDTKTGAICHKPQSQNNTYDRQLNIKAVEAMR